MNYGFVRHGIVYVATNKVTGEQYVGQTVASLRRRMTNHKHSVKIIKTSFAEAMRKYGFENFAFSEVYVSFDAEDLNLAEKKIICDIAPAYNMTAGGMGSVKHVCSVETRSKMSASMKATIAKPEVRAKWSSWNIGRKKPEKEINATAKAKWKPVYCKELGVSFLNCKFAAEFLNTCKSNITEAIKRKGKVKQQYTLARVA